jgi:hypothetical protein
LTFITLGSNGLFLVRKTFCCLTEQLSSIE